MPLWELSILEEKQQIRSQVNLVMTEASKTLQWIHATTHVRQTTSGQEKHWESDAAALALPSA